MIALLFTLFVLAMILAWRNYSKASYLVFAAALTLSVYWLDYHATTPLNINL